VASRSTVCGLLVAVLTTVNVPLRGPATVAVAWSAMKQFAPACS
jgi:hypothetical protein